MKSFTCNVIAEKTQASNPESKVVPNILVLLDGSACVLSWLLSFGSSAKLPSDVAES